MIIPNGIIRTIVEFNIYNFPSTYGVMMGTCPYQYPETACAPTDNLHQEFDGNNNRQTKKKHIRYNVSVLRCIKGCLTTKTDMLMSLALSFPTGSDCSCN